MPISKLSYSDEENQFLKNIGFKIQFERKKANLSQEQLAEKSGLSYTTISHLESTSVYGLSIVSVYRIAKALNISPEQLLRFD